MPKLVDLAGFEPELGRAAEDSRAGPLPSGAGGGRRRTFSEPPLWASLSADQQPLLADEEGAAATADDDDDDESTPLRVGRAPSLVVETLAEAPTFFPKAFIYAADGRRALWQLLVVCVAMGTCLILATTPPMFSRRHCPGDAVCDPAAAQRTLGIFLMVCLLWATEVVPIWVTSLAIPVLVVLLRVLVEDREGRAMTLSALDTAHVVSGLMFGKTVLVAFGAFAMSLALTKYDLSFRLAVLVLSRVGTRPGVVLAAIMFLGLFLCMWITNIAAPVVMLTCVAPMLSELPQDEPYIKTVLLGIAFSNNIGGMITPIASAQNLVAYDVIRSQSNTLDYAGPRPPGINWLQWLAVGIPFSVVCTAVVWVFLWMWHRPKLASVRPVPPRDPQPITFAHCVVLVVCLCTVVMWAFESQLAAVFGDAGIVALIPIVVLFGSGLLPPSSLLELSWPVLLLLSGGLVLGEAMKSSYLLAILAETMADAVKDQNVWVVCLVFSSFIWLFANFISHTVAAIVVLPVIASVGCALGGGNCNAGHFRLLVMSAVFVDSGAMALPVTSFPNAQTFAWRMPSTGQQVLTTLDFAKGGVPLGVCELVLLTTAAFGLLIALGF